MINNKFKIGLLLALMGIGLDGSGIYEIYINPTNDNVKFIIALVIRIVGYLLMLTSSL